MLSTYAAAHLSAWILHVNTLSYIPCTWRMVSNLLVWRQEPFETEIKIDDFRQHKPNYCVASNNSTSLSSWLRKVNQTSFGSIVLIASFDNQKSWNSTFWKSDAFTKQAKGYNIAPRLVNRNVIFACNRSDGTKAQNDTLQEFRIDKTHPGYRTCK